MVDQPPVYPLPRQWLCFKPPNPPSPEVLKHTLHLQAIWSQEMPDHPRWKMIYCDLVSSSLVAFGDDTNDSTDQINVGEFGGWTNLIIHRLLRMRPKEASSMSKETVIEEACRLGTLLFMVMVWRCYGVSPVVSSIIVKKLKALLDMYQPSWGRLWPIHLWAVYLGAVEAEGTLEESWYHEEMATLIKSYLVRDWDEAMKEVRGVLWFACLVGNRHDRLAKTVERLLKPLGKHG